jgi:hypothetical protein
MKLNGVLRGVLLMAFGAFLMADAVLNLGLIGKAGQAAGTFRPGMVAGPVALMLGAFQIWRSRPKPKA